jgi:helix-turn-helix protein
MRSKRWSNWWILAVTATPVIHALAVRAQAAVRAAQAVPFQALNALNFQPDNPAHVFDHPIFQVIRNKMNATSASRATSGGAVMEAMEAMEAA